MKFCLMIKCRYFIIFKKDLLLLMLKLFIKGFINILFLTIVIQHITRWIIFSLELDFYVYLSCLKYSWESLTFKVQCHCITRWKMSNFSVQCCNKVDYALLLCTFHRKMVMGSHCILTLCNSIYILCFVNFQKHQNEILYFCLSHEMKTTK